MRNTLLIILGLLISLAVQAQGIEEAIQQASKNELKTLEQVVDFINAHASSDREKALGAYYFVATTLKFDPKELKKEKKEGYIEPVNIFKRGKAAGNGFSALYQYLCMAMGIECYTIPGYSKTIGYTQGQTFSFSNHSWNIVKLKSEWFFVDVAWGSGHIKKGVLGYRVIKQYSRKHFAQTPLEFVLTHLPEAPMWQFHDNPVPLKVFVAGEKKIQAHLRTSPAKSYFYIDSLKHYFSLPSVQADLYYGYMVYRFNKANTLPLATALFSSVRERMNPSIDYKSVAQIDSLIRDNEFGVKILRKRKKTIWKSVNILVGQALYIGIFQQGVLYRSKAGFWNQKMEVLKEKKAIDSLLYCSRLMFKAQEKSVTIYKELNDESYDYAEASLAESYLHYLQLYYSYLQTEKSATRLQNIRKEMGLMKSGAKKYLRSSNSYYQQIITFSTKVS